MFGKGHTIEGMALPAINAPIVRVYAGDTTDFGTFTFQENNVNMNLSTWTWKAQWRESHDAPTALNLTVDGSAANTGVINVSASAAVTAKMKDNGVWDLQGTGPDGEVYTWARGKTVLYPDVTRA